MKQPIQLSDHFTYGRLLRFTLPSICMMIFTSIYGMVDGYFSAAWARCWAWAAARWWQKRWAKTIFPEPEDISR